MVIIIVIILTMIMKRMPSCRLADEDQEVSSVRSGNSRATDDSEIVVCEGVLLGEESGAGL